ncbi:MAG: HlyD family efflux transporter periplasmic adaptor subunit [Reichenbachiella sp.]
MSKRLISALLGVLVIVIIIFSFSNSSDSETTLWTEVVRGDLQIEVVTTGELEARHSVKIVGPGNGMRSARIWDSRLEDLVPEGTIVKKGDYVAKLDVSTLDNNIKNNMDDLTKVESTYISTKLDTTLTLREKRNEILNLTFTVEEKRIKLEQSAFEPPATIKQAEMDVKKAERELNQSKENYQIKKQQMIAKMTVATANRDKSRRKNNILKELKEKFTIKAPEDGMVIYAKGWSGNKVKVGENIRAWDPVVATLPDLSQMISRTYVNEVDIRKIKTGQEVLIGLDAFPDKTLTGKVTEVANVGEQKPNSDSKVFEVTVLIHEYDSILRPSMTTSNNILTKHIQDCLYVPLEALQSQGDSISYVILKDGVGFTKQEVKIGDVNDQSAVILEGVKEGATLALNEAKSIVDEPIALLQ